MHKLIITIFMPFIFLLSYADNTNVNDIIAAASHMKQSTEPNVYNVRPVQTHSSIVQEREIESIGSKREEEKEQYHDYANEIQKTGVAKASKYEKYAKEEGKKATDKLLSSIHEEKQSTNMIIFASLGMPTESLAEITLQAHKYEIPIVIRGLYKNDYKSTASRIEEILTVNSKDHPVGGFSIDPNWFEVYKINKVPAFILTPELAVCPESDISNCDIPNYDIIYGNITVESALQQFSKRGDYKNIANELLVKGKE